MPYSYHNEPDYFGAALFFGICLFIVVVFGGLWYSVHLDDQRAQQCIDAGKDWIDSNCLTRK